MKIGSFVIGGLAGAAIVMMMQRKGTMSALAANVGSNWKRRVGGMRDGAIEKALGMKFSSSFKRASDRLGDASESLSDESALNEVKKLAAQDPKVSKEIHSILEENGEHRI